MYKQFMILRNGASLPILDNTAQTLTFPASETYVFFIGGKYYTSAIPDTGAVVNLIYTGSTAKVILWDITAKTFLVVDYSVANNYRWTHIIFATYRVAAGKAYLTMTAKIDFTIAGEPDVKPMYKQFKVLRSGRYYPIIDTLMKTLTFPASNYEYVFFVGGAYYVNAIPAAGSVITLETTGSSAKAILWDITAKTFLTVAYSAVSGYALTHILFATYRYDVDGKFYISMPDIPYVQDDKLLGILASSTKMEVNAHVKAVNHRGWNTAPENTLSAFKLSKRKGFNYVECDVRFTADNVPVLLHDTTINRTSNGTGLISALNYGTVRDLDFGAWKNAVYAGEKIPALSEFILLCKKQSIHPYLHINTLITESQATELFDIIKQYGMKRHVTWLSFDLISLQKILVEDPYARVAIFVDTLTEAAITTTASLKTESNDVFINAGASSITSALVAFAIAAGIYIEAWGVVDAASANTLVGYGVDGLTVDDFNVADSLNV